MLKTTMATMMVGIRFLLALACLNAVAAYVSPSPILQRLVRSIPSGLTCLGSSRIDSPESQDGSATAVVHVALTREEGKNAKLAAALAKKVGICALELPCIAHADGDDYPRLKEVLKSQQWDYITITSPEGAKVLASVLNREENIAIPPIAAVGKATEEELRGYGLDVSFCPSKATATTLVAELPGAPPLQILYPASQRAQLTLETGLRGRGFHVTRLNTYDTVTAEWTDELRDAASRCQVATFASPSSVKGWLHNSIQKTNVIAACIGETSAKACRELGWSEDKIFYPDKPGIDSWVEAIDQAVMSLSPVPHS
jgi:uroporphyrinogen-III synthase